MSIFKIELTFFETISLSQTWITKIPISSDYFISSTTISEFTHTLSVSRTSLWPVYSFETSENSLFSSLTEALSKMPFTERTSEYSSFSSITGTSVLTRTSFLSDEYLFDTVQTMPNARIKCCNYLEKKIKWFTQSTVSLNESFSCLRILILESESSSRPLKSFTTNS